MRSQSSLVPILYAHPFADIYVADGAATGMRYYFSTKSPIQLVDPSDVPELLSRRRREGCCGSPPTDYALFEEVPTNG